MSVHFPCSATVHLLSAACRLRGVRCNIIIVKGKLVCGSGDGLAVGAILPYTIAPNLMRFKLIK